MGQHAVMAGNGRVVIPASVRSQLGLEEGARFVVHVENGSIRLEPFTDALARVRAELRRYVPEGVSLADELSEDRRREAELE